MSIIEAGTQMSSYYPLTNCTLWVANIHRYTCLVQGGTSRGDFLAVHSKSVPFPMISVVRCFGALTKCR